jgi:hypothetical protein
MSSFDFAAILLVFAALIGVGNELTLRLPRPVEPGRLPLVPEGADKRTSRIAQGRHKQMDLHPPAADRRRGRAEVDCSCLPGAVSNRRHARASACSAWRSGAAARSTVRSDTPTPCSRSRSWRTTYAPERWIDDALLRPEVRDAYRRLVEQGWTDALRALHPGERIYTSARALSNSTSRGTPPKRWNAPSMPSNQADCRSCRKARTNMNSGLPPDYRQRFCGASPRSA